MKRLLRFGKTHPPSPWTSRNRVAYVLVVLVLLVSAIPMCLLTFGYAGSGLGKQDSITLISATELITGMPTVPKWSPSGTRIVFGHSDGKIYVIEADGSHVQPISEGSEEHHNDQFPDISADGTRVAYSTLRYKTGFLWDAEHNYEIVTSSLDGSDKHRLTTNKALDAHPVWSPDGNWIAFVSNRSPGTAFHVFVMQPDGSNVRQIVSSVASSIDGPPVWSPDGSKIAFVGEAEEFEVIDGRGYSDAIYSVGSDGSDLTSLGNTLSSPAWSPDGRRVAFIRRKAGSDIGILYTMNHDGSDPQAIISLEEPEAAWTRRGNVTWSPDGSEIQFGSSIIGVDGSRPRHLPGHRNAWSPDGSRLATSDIRFDKRFQGQDFALHTVARDGSDRRVLVTEKRDGSLSASHGRPASD